MQLQKAIDLFLATKTNARTRANNLFALRPMVEWIGPDRDVNDISCSELVAYSVEVKNNGRSAVTNNRALLYVRSFFNWLVRLHEIPDSPASVIELPSIPVGFDENKAMTDEEFEAIIDYIKYKPRDYALFLFLADTGCRRSGAAGLTIYDIDLEKRIAVVTEKGDPPRRVGYGQECARAIAAWLNIRVGDLGDFVFSKRGKKLDPMSISQIVRRASLKATGISRGPHSLRHRKGFMMGNCYVPQTLISRVLGHRSELTTMSYMPRDWESAREVIDDFAYVPPVGDREPEPKPKIIKFPGASSQ